MKYILFVFYFIFFGSVFSQREVDSIQSAMDDDYKKFVEAENKRFESFREKENKEFALFLKSEWTEYTDFIQFDKPKSPPIPKDEVAPDAPSDDVEVVPSDKSKPVVQKDPDNSNEFDESDQEENVRFELSNTFELYGDEFEVGYTNDVTVKVGGITSDAISDYWSRMSNGDYSLLMSQIRKTSIANNFSDWQVFQFVRSLSTSFHTKESEQIALQFFVLNQLGYDVKMAIQNNAFILLLPIEQKVYGKYCLEIDRKRYYLWSNSNKPVQTIKEKFNANSSPINLLAQQVSFEQGREISRVMKLPTGQGVLFKINKAYIDYLKDFPQCELVVHFNTPLTSQLKKDVHRYFDPLLENKSELEKANFLLKLMHQSFKYKTDDDQFGEEKWFFPEESIFYPFSDCEDRSVMYARLIKELTSLEIIGLSYDDHVATAIKLNKPIGDCIDYNGGIYSVFDPSYINAQGGMSMSNYKSVRPEVIEVLFK